MITFSKTKDYTLKPCKNRVGYFVSKTSTCIQFKLYWNEKILINHISIKENLYADTFFTRTRAVFIAEMHNHIHGEKDGKLDWNGSKTIQLQNTYNLLNAFFKFYLLIVIIINL